MQKFVTEFNYKTKADIYLFISKYFYTNALHTNLGKVNNAVLKIRNFDSKVIIRA